MAQNGTICTMRRPNIANIVIPISARICQPACSSTSSGARVFPPLGRTNLSVCLCISPCLITLLPVASEADRNQLRTLSDVCVLESPSDQYHLRNRIPNVYKKNRYIPEDILLLPSRPLWGTSLSARKATVVPSTSVA